MYWITGQIDIIITYSYSLQPQGNNNPLVTFNNTLSYINKTNTATRPYYTS